MAFIGRRNKFGVKDGDPAFEIATNLCDYFELGAKPGNGHWLEGQIVGNGEFIFNGRLYLPPSDDVGASDPGTIIDNFPKSAAPNGWSKHPAPDGNGYDLKSADGTLLFGYRVEGNICRVTTRIYGVGGQLVAECQPEEFRIHQGPARIGRGGLLMA